MKRSLAIIMSLFILMASVPTFAKDAEELTMYATGLVCEYLENPIGIDEAVPRLGWKDICKQRQK